MAPDSQGASAGEARNRLKEHFSSLSKSNQSVGWSKLWDAGDFLPWDRGVPNPALTDTLTQRQDLLGTCFVTDSKGTRQRKQALVPGCGRGYDVLLLASLGYDAYGLDVSDSAIECCLEEQQGTNSSKYPLGDAAEGGGKARFIKGDFFSDDWLEAATQKKTFDLIYDYTFFCALPPPVRPVWARRMSKLLAANPSGHLICLEFPTYKDPAAGGPPFGLTPDTYVQHLSSPGRELFYDDAGHVKGSQQLPTDLSRGALERFAHWQPERTHEIGKGTDWISIWRHNPSVGLL